MSYRRTTLIKYTPSSYYPQTGPFASETNTTSDFFYYIGSGFGVSSVIIAGDSTAMINSAGIPVVGGIEDQYTTTTGGTALTASADGKSLLSTQYYSIPASNTSFGPYNSIVTSNPAAYANGSGYIRGLRLAQLASLPTNYIQASGLSYTPGKRIGPYAVFLMYANSPYYYYEKIYIGAPNQVGGIGVTTGSGTATVSWSAPSTNYLPITGYVVRIVSGGSVVTSKTVSSGTSTTFTELANGDYTAYVVACCDYGYSIDSAPTSFTVAPSPPGAPTIGTATRQSPTSVNVSFTPPVLGAGEPTIQNYTVTAIPSSGTGNVTASGVATPITVIGLTSSTSYTFTVKATNANGTGLDSASSNKIVGIPNLSTPTGITPAAGSINWAGITDSAGTTYKVYRDGSFVTTASSPYMFGGLTSNTSYSIQVSAVNGGVEGDRSTAVTLLTTPNAPTIDGVTAGNGNATISYTPASGGSTTLVTYTVTSNPGGKTGTVERTGLTSGTITVSGLTNGTSYTFTMTAGNTSGASAVSNASSSVTLRTTPGAPTITSVTAANSKLIVAFTAPVSDGGDAITGYEYSINGGSTWVSKNTSSPFDITGLTNGTTYTVQLRAVNGAGSGEAVESTPEKLLGTLLSASFVDKIFEGGKHKLRFSLTADPNTTLPASIADYTVTLLSAVAGGAVGGVVGGGVAGGAVGGVAGGVTGTPVSRDSLSLVDGNIVISELSDYTTYEFAFSTSNCAVNPNIKASGTTYDKIAPGVVNATTVIPGNHSLTLNWGDVADTTGSLIRYYVFNTQDEEDINAALNVDVDDGNKGYAAGAGEYTFTINNLPNGTPVSFYVRAFDAEGNKGIPVTFTGTPVPSVDNSVADITEYATNSIATAPANLVSFLDSLDSEKLKVSLNNIAGNSGGTPAISYLAPLITTGTANNAVLNQIGRSSMTTALTLAEFETKDTYGRYTDLKNALTDIQTVTKNADVIAGAVANIFATTGGPTEEATMSILTATRSAPELKSAYFASLVENGVSSDPLPIGGAVLDDFKSTFTTGSTMSDAFAAATTVNVIVPSSEIIPINSVNANVPNYLAITPDISYTLKNGSSEATVVYDRSSLIVNGRVVALGELFLVGDRAFRIDAIGTGAVTYTGGSQLAAPEIFAVEGSKYTDPDSLEVITQIDVTWTSVANATSYVVTIWSSNDLTGFVTSEDILDEDPETSEKRWSFQNPSLTPGTQYYVTVRAKDSNYIYADSIQSAPYNFFATQLATPAPVVEGYTITWVAVPNTVRFIIDLADETGDYHVGPIPVLTNGAEVYTYTFTDLLPGTNYSIGTIIAYANKYITSDPGRFSIVTEPAIDITTAIDALLTTLNSDSDLGAFKTALIDLINSQGSSSLSTNTVTDFSKLTTANYNGVLAGGPTNFFIVKNGATFTLPTDFDTSKYVYFPNTPGSASSYTIAWTGGSTVVSFDAAGVMSINGSVLPLGGTFTLRGQNYVYKANGSGIGAPFTAAPCFFGDAPVKTPAGYRRMDSLTVGDVVVTPTGEAVAIHRVKKYAIPAGPATNPYVIPVGQYGAVRRVLISPDHKVCLPDGRRVEAKRLGLDQEERNGMLTYYNLELVGEADMVVGGVAVESLAHVRRVVISPAQFKALLVKQYGNGPVTREIMAQIRRNCRFLSNGNVEVPLRADQPM